MYRSVCNSTKVRGAEFMERSFGRYRGSDVSDGDSSFHCLEDNVDVIESILKGLNHVLNGVEVLLMSVLRFLDLLQASYGMLSVL